jgi:thioredoxin-related protein
MFVALTAKSQTSTISDKSPVKWYTIQEAEKLFKQSPRPFFIDAYTDWCGWCKKMDKDTFTNSVISGILNTRYYPVKFDAEGKDSVVFLGTKFINDGKYGKAHQLAVALLKGQLAYPTVVFLIPQSDGKLILEPVPGYKEPKEMESMLNYYVDNNFTRTKLEDFQKSFVGKVK